MVDRLIEHVIGDAGDPMADELASWLARSPRFRAFAEEYRDKIRKKLRGAIDAEARLDVRAELIVASRLLADRRIGLEWEAHGSTRGGPDFTLSYRSNHSFNLEVTRIRSAAATDGGPMLAKLRQLPPSAPNVLLIVQSQATFDPEMAARSMRARADAKDEDFFARRGFRDTRQFYDRFLRLGAVIAWADASAAVWVNRSARIAVPDRALRATVAALEDGSGH